MVRQERTIDRTEKRKNLTSSSVIIAILIGVIVLSMWYYTGSARRSSFEETKIETSSAFHTPLSTQPSKSTGADEDLALDFTLVDLEGKSFRLSDYRGKVVIIDFMATLCGPCRVKVSHLGGIWEKYKDRAIIISIDLNPNETPEMLRDFSDQFPYATWIWAKDTENLGYKYGIVSIPTTIVIDKEGYVKARYTWVTPNTVLIEEVERLLG